MKIKIIRLTFYEIYGASILAKKSLKICCRKKKNNKYYAREKHDILNNKIKPYATYYAQDVRVADNNSFAETLKYLCKTHTEVFNEVSQEPETKLAYEPRIMDIIFLYLKTKSNTGI